MANTMVGPPWDTWGKKKGEVARLAGRACVAGGRAVVADGTDLSARPVRDVGATSGCGMRYGTGVALVVAAAVSWSLTGLAIRQIGTDGPWAILFWRSLGVLPVLAGVIWWTRGALIGPLRETGTAGVIGGLGLVLAFAGAIYAFQATSVANAVFLFAASPFITAALGRVVLHERVHPLTWACMAVAGFGMFLMVREGLSAGAGPGNAAALLSAFGFACFTLTLRWGKLSDMLPATFLGGVFSAIAAGAILLATDGTVMIPARDIVICLLMGAFLLAAGLTLYTLGSKALRAADLTLLSNIEVLLAPFWVWLVLGETTGAATLLGGLVLLAAVVTNGLIGLRRSAAA
jgi:drug/metabolite transporter, DME family